MAYHNNSTNLFAVTPSDGNFDPNPDWTSMLAADTANVPTFEALADHRWDYPMAGTSTGTSIQKKFGEHHDHCFVDWRLTFDLQILWLLPLNQILQILTATLSRCTRGSNRNP